MMNILLLVVSLLITMAIVMGMSKADEVEWGIELAHPRFNSFELGITNRNYTWDSGDEEQEIRVGLLIITISVSFFKNSA